MQVNASKSSASGGKFEGSTAAFEYGAERERAGERTRLRGTIRYGLSSGVIWSYLFASWDGWNHGTAVIKWKSVGMGCLMPEHKLADATVRDMRIQILNVRIISLTITFVEKNFICINFMTCVLHACE